MTKRRGWIAAAVVGLLLVLCGQVIHAVRGESLTWDEGDHIFAGYMTWKTGDYGLNPEHPPMVKMLATVPLLALPLKVPKLQGRWFKDEAYLDGRELLFHNGPADGGQYGSQTLVFRVRMFAMLFTVVAALLVFSAGAEMFGVEAGLLALLLFCFEPTLLAHGAYVTTDMAASCTIFGTVYAMWRWVRQPSWQRLLVVGLAAGVALGAKHSTVLLAPILLVLLLGEWVMRNPTIGAMKQSRSWGTLLRLMGALVVVVFVGCVVLWGFYGFRFAARPAGLSLAPSLKDYVGPLAGIEAHGILFAGKYHLLPESWLYGLTDVRSMANGMPSYFFGRVYAHGVWFYFPVLFTIKATLGMMGLLLLTVFAAAKGWLRGGRELWFLVAPPAAYLLVAMNSHLNIGARHILPVFVFCCVLAGVGAQALLAHGRAKSSKAWQWVVVVLLATHIGSSIVAAPNYIAYANEAWGGPDKTYEYLTDSNTDWAQQLVATADYVHEHQIKDCWIAYFAAPFLLPADYGIPCKRLPTPDSGFEKEELPVPQQITGPVLISAGDLNGFELGSKVLNPYESFRGLKPVAAIQHGIFVYEGTFQVPLASATSHALASGRLLTAKDVAGAVAEAKLGESMAAGEVATEMALGKALFAAGDQAGATAAFDRMAAKVETMEPGAREQWRATVKELRETGK